MNDYCTSFVEAFGRKLLTNCFHMVIADHVHDCMVEWRNLSRYSEQGWEALNSLIKCFFFRRTNKGGRKNNENI